MRIPGIQAIKKPNGTVYYYHRATKTRIKAPPHTAEFAAEVAAIEKAAAEKADVGADKKTPNTWGWLVVLWKTTPEWKRLSARTKEDYQGVLDYLANLDDQPLSAFTAPQVMAIRNKAFDKKKRRFANYVLAVISRAWTIGQGLGKVPHPNPVCKEHRIARPKNARDVNRPWKVEEVEEVLAVASQPIRVAVVLALWAGWREGDVCKMKRSSYDGANVEGRQGKTGDLVWMPAHSALRAVLDAELERLPRTPDANMVINQKGRGFTENGFRASFFKLIRNLVEKKKIGAGLTFHGLRVTLATAIAEAGGDTRAIAAALGHATETMARHYARHAERKRDARRAIALLEHSEDESL